MIFPDIDPIALNLGFFQIRWYALAYLTGFLGGWFYAVRLTRLYTNDIRPHAEDIENLVTWVVLGVIFGGRFGYVLFYNIGYFLEHPMEVFYLWQGGMSFHGGMLGVLIALVGYTKYHNISLLRTGDIICSVVPIGLFCGRLSNFVNAELFGRTTDVPWGVIFPNGGPLPRHPSQLYEAFFEGGVLLILLGVLMYKTRLRETPGVIAGIFFIGYGLARFGIEFVREPDAHLGFIFSFLSMGQILSIPMIIFGSGLIFYARRYVRS